MSSFSNAISPVNDVVGKIVKRYANPERSAYCYLFHVRPDADFAPLLPNHTEVYSAWVDEGAGFATLDPEEALVRCEASQSGKLGEVERKTLGSSHLRKQQMARVVCFSVIQVAPDQIAVHLVSRALNYAPKGDRVVDEMWKPSAEHPADGWFSVYIPR